jgi:hypothetical protein
MILASLKGCSDQASEKLFANPFIKEIQKSIQPFIQLLMSWGQANVNDRHNIVNARTTGKSLLKLSLSFFCRFRTWQNLPSTK